MSYISWINCDACWRSLLFSSRMAGLALRAPRCSTIHWTKKPKPSEPSWQRYVCPNLAALACCTTELCSSSDILKIKWWHCELTVNFGVLMSSLVHILPVKIIITLFPPLHEAWCDCRGVGCPRHPQYRHQNAQSSWIFNWATQFLSFLSLWCVTFPQAV